jgi:hypothetical protein
LIPSKIRINDGVTPALRNFPYLAARSDSLNI